MISEFHIYELGSTLTIEYTVETTPEPRTDTLEHQHTIIEDRYEVDVLEVKIDGLLIECSRELRIILENKIENFLIENPDEIHN